ncbi:hypothetical protein C5167_002122 [Papaver somniferum]|uniref:DNA-directed RNA polymerase subunit n=1 Tax=Papaver somniferum TaxID=3469 RepID=A0A4Y7KZY7_PAPSO|nr:hypothetical protein C5167_002122 [Papaver somniferum]
MSSIVAETVINSIQNYSTEDKKTPHSRFEEGPVEEVEIFFLSLVEHTLRLPPHLLSLPLPEAIQGELEKLFVDKVIAQLGLCISVYDIKSIKGGFIFAGDGASTYTVDFRLIMFRPFEGDILSGKVDASDANGLRLVKMEDGHGCMARFVFRVHKISYPPIPLEQEKDSKAFAPMVITASIDFDGLGPISWWV